MRHFFMKAARRAMNSRLETCERIRRTILMSMSACRQAQSRTQALNQSRRRFARRDHPIIFTFLTGGEQLILRALLKNINLIRRNTSDKFIKKCDPSVETMRTSTRDAVPLVPLFGIVVTLYSTSYTAPITPG